MENKGGSSSQELQLQVEILLGGLSPASSLALVQGAGPTLSSPQGCGAWREGVSRNVNNGVWHLLTPA